MLKTLTMGNGIESIIRTGDLLDLELEFMVLSQSTLLPTVAPVCSE